MVEMKFMVLNAVKLLPNDASAILLYDKNNIVYDNVFFEICRLFLYVQRP